MSTMLAKFVFIWSKLQNVGQNVISNNVCVCLCVFVKVCVSVIVKVCVSVCL